MKITFKIVGAPPGKNIIELDVSPKDTILDIKYKLIKKGKFKNNSSKFEIYYPRSSE